MKKKIEMVKLEFEWPKKKDANKKIKLPSIIFYEVGDVIKKTKKNINIANMLNYRLKLYRWF